MSTEKVDGKQVEASHPKMLKDLATGHGIEVPELIRRVFRLADLQKITLTGKETYYGVIRVEESQARPGKDSDRKTTVSIIWIIDSLKFAFGFATQANEGAAMGGRMASYWVYDKDGQYYPQPLVSPRQNQNAVTQEELRLSRGRRG